MSNEDIKTIGFGLTWIGTTLSSSLIIAVWLYKLDFKTDLDSWDDLRVLIPLIVAITALGFMILGTGLKEGVREAVRSFIYGVKSTKIVE